jgi:glucose/arabinose dehydrogenase
MKAPALRFSRILLVLLCGGLWCANAFAAPARFRVLVFSKTAGFRHSSIPQGVVALRQLGRQHDFAVDATEDAAAFTAANLRQYAAVVFLNTTGDVLDDAQQQAFEGYLRQGGGFVGVHAAADTEYDWPWYGGLVGAYFDSHPAQQEASVLVLDPQHPSTQGLPERWQRFDEWYNYKSSPRGNVHVLAALQEKSYEGGTMGHDHPITWAHVYDGGRAWYTGLGHTEASYTEPLFLQHLLGGIEWAAGARPGDAGATLTSSFEKVVLTKDITDPMELGVARDGRVFIAERQGAIKLWEPATGTARMVGYLPVRMTIEDGLLGLTLDPNFERNGWLYVYYAPADGGPQRLARLTFHDGQIDPASERVLLEIPIQQEECCHSGGSLTFGPDGTLYLSTGDNSDPYPLGGSPLDERPGHKAGDAQRTSANTNDLRGKILRIRPLPDGTYAIPPGNLFPADAWHRPEIYTMGHRNPFRIAVDAKTGWLYWGDVGLGNPPSEERGPWGWEEYNQARGPGFYGWPYFVGPNDAYRDFDHATRTPGPFFDPQKPVNDSPNNTGARELPPAQSALIWYTYGALEDFPEMGDGGMSAMAGPVYRPTPTTASPYALPAYYDGVWFIYEWMRDWIKEVRFDADGRILKISPFLPGMTFSRPMDMEMGADGRLYVIEWGVDFWGSNDNAQVVRLDYHGSARRPPVARAAATPASGPAPLPVQFSGAASQNRNGTEPLTYAWDFDGDGRVDARTPAPAFTYARPGAYTAHLTVTDAHGLVDSTQVAVVVGNTAPVVNITWPPEGGIFDYDAPIKYAVSVSDAETPVIDPRHVTVQTWSGHDTHTHLLTRPVPERTGIEGTVRITREHTHRADLHLQDRFAVVEAAYTDAGVAGLAPLTTTARVVLQPRRKEAEHARFKHEIERQTVGKHPAEWDFPETDMTFLLVRNGSFLGYQPINLAGIDGLTLRVKPQAGGRIEVRLDAPDGPMLADLAIDAAATTVSTDAGASVEHDLALAIPEDVAEAYQGWQEHTVPLTDPGGTHTLYLVFHGPDGTLLHLDWILFQGQGVVRRRDESYKE